MAIRRCPYCKAIIDEGAEFCTNCGTQLLFPDDENIEEEIPGEKIVDEDQEEEEAGSAEKEEENGHFSGEREEPFKEKPEKSSEVFEKDRGEVPPEPLVKEEDVFSGDLDDGPEEKQKDEEWDVEESGGEDSVEPVPVESDSEIDSAELEEREIVKFIDSIKRDRGEAPDLPPPFKPEEQDLEEASPEPLPEDDLQAEEPEQEDESFGRSFSPSASQDEDSAQKPLGEVTGPPQVEESHPSPTPGEEFFKREGIRVPTGSLPPWASKIKEDQTPDIFPAEDDREGFPEAGEKEPDFGEETVSDEPFSTETEADLPEGVSQKNLPFSEGSFDGDVEIHEKNVFRRSAWLKSRLFDISIMAAVWLVAVVIASLVMNVGFFRLIGASALLLGVFFFILLAGYFFLFFFFLGETLGDYVFNAGRQSESRRPV